MAQNPIVLCILDGWGEATAAPDNAISSAHTPTWNRIKSTYPFRTLGASGPAVGLPEGQMGNSEVGHMTIGSGQIMFQDLPRISKTIADGTLPLNPALQDLISTLKKTAGACHIMGLVSNGGVHSHINHIKALMGELHKNGIPVYLHAFLDGRDTPPASAKIFLQELIHFCHQKPNVDIATISGRYDAMDRDQNWQRTEKAYNAIVSAQGPIFQDPLTMIDHLYQHGITDEFIPPHVNQNYPGVGAHDAFLMANFRADRVRQLLTALTAEDFKDFKRVQAVFDHRFYGMTEYASWLTPLITALFPSQMLQQTLGEVLEEQQMTQYRLAETEKYAHVTYFFNGGREDPFVGEERLVIPTPKVATYDEKPEMAALELTDHLCKAIESQRYDLIVVNYANADMVGHTGNLQASIKAVEVLDTCLNKIEASVLTARGKLLITADHGNIEQMLSEKNGKPHTAHTCSPVPAVLIGADRTFHDLSAGLADIAPTVLDLLNIKKPSHWDGQSLLTSGNS